MQGLAGMELLQTAMRYHLGEAGVIFIAVTLFLFSFSTFLGILFYARSNVAYLFGDNWASQTAYKVLALVMLIHRRNRSVHICMGSGRCRDRADDGIQYSDPVSDGWPGVG